MVGRVDDQLTRRRQQPVMQPVPAGIARDRCRTVRTRSCRRDRCRACRRQARSRRAASSLPMQNSQWPQGVMHWVTCVQRGHLTGSPKSAAVQVAPAGSARARPGRRSSRSSRSRSGPACGSCRCTSATATPTSSIRRVRRRVGRVVRTRRVGVHRIALELPFAAVVAHARVAVEEAVLLAGVDVVARDAGREASSRRCRAARRTRDRRSRSCRRRRCRGRRCTGRCRPRVAAAAGRSASRRSHPPSRSRPPCRVDSALTELPHPGTSTRKAPATRAARR